MTYFDFQEIETKDRNDLLQYVVGSIAIGELNIATSMNPEIGWFLSKIFKPEGGIGGDHLWAIEHIPVKGSLGQFRLYRGDDIDQTEENSLYDADEVIDALFKAFHNHKMHFPNHESTVAEILKRIPEYRENLRT